MEATVSYLLILQKCISSKQNTLKQEIIHCGNVFKDFTTNNMIKTGLKEIVNYFFVDFNIIYTNNILDIHRYLMNGK